MALKLVATVVGQTVAMEPQETLLVAAVEALLVSSTVIHLTQELLL